MKTKLIQKIKEEWEEFKDRHSLNDECNVHDAWDFWIYRYKKAISQSKEELVGEIKNIISKELYSNGAITISGKSRIFKSLEEYEKRKIR